ncbi:MAG: hypothetical protein ABEL76_14650 [Bradymonadaceae bacterium]
MNRQLETDDGSPQEAIFLWVMWSGFLLATIGEVALFVGALEHPAIAGETEAVLSVGWPALTTALAMIGAAVAVKRFELGGGGIPTALMTWLPFKAVAISGLITYSLHPGGGAHWLFLIAFAVGMAAYNPGRFRVTGPAVGAD